MCVFFSSFFTNFSNRSYLVPVEVFIPALKCLVTPLNLHTTLVLVLVLLDQNRLKNRALLIDTIVIVRDDDSKDPYYTHVGIPESLELILMKECQANLG